MRHVASKLPSACWSDGLLYGKMHKIWYLIFPNCPLKANTFSPLIPEDYTGSWGVYAMPVWDQTKGGVQAWEEAAALPIPSWVHLRSKKPLVMCEPQVASPLAGWEVGMGQPGGRWGAPLLPAPRVSFHPLLHLHPVNPECHRSPVTHYNLPHYFSNPPSACCQELWNHMSWQVY